MEEERTGADYFSIRTREALFVVFVRTRPWRKLLRGVRKDGVADVCSPLLFVWWMLSLSAHSVGVDGGRPDREISDCIVNQPQSTLALQYDSHQRVFDHRRLCHRRQLSQKEKKKVTQPFRRAIGDVQSLALWSKSQS